MLEHTDMIYKVKSTDKIVYDEYTEGIFTITKVPYYKVSDEQVLPLNTIMYLSKQIEYMFSNDIESMEYMYT